MSNSKFLYPVTDDAKQVNVYGTFEGANGKMYRANGRWAKVWTTKCIGRMSVAFGHENEVKAFDVWSNKTELTLTLKECRFEAMEWVLKGKV